MKKESPMWHSVGILAGAVILIVAFTRGWLMSTLPLIAAGTWGAWLLATQRPPASKRKPARRPRSADTAPVPTEGRDAAATNTLLLLHVNQKVEISKKDITNGDELRGAHLRITDADGSVVAEWVTDGQPHRIDRPQPGEYVLTETAAPNGYRLAESVCFMVEESGRIQKVTMYDAPVGTFTIWLKVSRFLCFFISWNKRFSLSSSAPPAKRRKIAGQWHLYHEVPQ